MADYGDDADAMVAALRERQDAMQQKTFTKWWNSYLRERDVAVEDLLTDLDDGLRLIDLMEIISGEYVGKFNKKPRVLAQKMENLEIGLNFIIGKQVDIRCGAGDIAEGNKKLILGLSWMLILRFEIQKYSADIQELLKWCKDKTRGYNGCDVQNFTQSFNDGLAFCALIHKHYPDKLDYDNLDHSDVMGNLQLAFRVADEEFNVPQLLDAADLASGQPDEKSVITYVAKLRQAFSDTDARNREEEERRRREEEERARLEALRKKREAELDAAGNQLNDLLPAFLDRQAHEAETDRLKDAFDAGASDLIEWIKEKDADLANKLANIPDDMEAVEAELNALTNDFQNGEKPPKFDDKCDLQDQYNNVNTRRQLEGRGPADYPHPMPEVDGLWDGMEDKEKAYMDALLDKMRTKGKVEPALDRFRRVAAKLRGWSDDNNAYVTGNDLGNSVAAVLANIQIHERFDNDVRLQINTLGWLERLAAPINQLGGAPEKQEVATTLGELHGWYDGKDQWAVARRQELQAELERQRQLEAARLAFDKATQDLLSAVEEAEEYANFPLVDDTEQDIAAVRARMDAVAPRVQTTPEGADGAAAADVLARYQALGGLLDQRVADIRNGVTPDFASPTDDPAYLAYNKTAANFDNWYIRMFKIIMVNPNEKSIRPDELASRVRNVRDGIPEGNAIIARAESDEQAIASKGLTPRPDPGTSIASMRSRVRMMESVCDKGDALVANPPARIDIAGVVRALDVFAGETPGQVETELLGTRVQGDNLAYIQGKTNDLGNGSIDYTGFADAHNTAGAGGSGAAIPTYTPAVKASTSTPAASTSSTPAATTPAATTPAATPAPAATTTRTPTTNVTTNPPAAGSVQRVAVADNIEIDGDRQARAISDGVTLYTTQSATPPVTMRYEVEISDYKKMGVKLDFTGSENIAMVVPEGSSTLVADDVVNPYEVKTICVVQQIDPYAPASLSVKTQWTTMEPVRPPLSNNERLPRPCFR